MGYELTVSRDDVRRVLKRARNLLKLGWTKGAEARNRYGHSVSVGCDNAVRYCASGAIQCAAGKNRTLAREAERFLSSLTTSGSVVNFNDAPDRTRDEVVGLFSRGISSLQ